MKKSIWLAIIGAAALTGCQSEVMQQREYIPAPREDVEPAKPAPEPYTTAPQTTEFEPAQPRQEAAPAPREYQPMNNTFTNKGVDEDAPMLKGGKKGGKKGAKAGKGGKTAAAGEYIVQDGDFPEKIARKHGVRLSDLMEANGLTEESAKKLRIGQKLIIPAKRGGKSGKGGKRGVGGGAPTAGPGEYIIQDGDFPEKIARKHGVRLSDLMEANGLDEESAKRLRIGQKLVIPAKRGGKGGATAGTERRGGSRRSGGESTARQETLKRTPVDGGYMVEVPRDMSVAEFAKLAGVTEEQLRELNPHLPDDRVKKDSIYTIPKD